jgi:TnpA family transposase
VPPAVPALRTRLRQLLQRRHLSALLWETQPWTNFLKAFPRLASRRPVPAAATSVQVAWVACVIAAGCTIGLRDRAVGGPGLSVEQLEAGYATYRRAETLAPATATLVNSQLQQPRAAAWGQGTPSSSEARVYGVPVRALTAPFQPTYFAAAGRGSAVSPHGSALGIAFYPPVLTCPGRPAPYLLEGWLSPATHLEPREHDTETQGYTDLLFAVCQLWGSRLAPRSKDWPAQRLWRLPGAEPSRHSETVLAGKLHVQRIRESWEERRRLVAALKRGEVRASLSVGKLGAASQRNKLCPGRQDLGRLVKTAYLAE